MSQIFNLAKNFIDIPNSNIILRNIKINMSMNSSKTVKIETFKNLGKISSICDYFFFLNYNYISQIIHGEIIIFRVNMNI